VRIVRGKLGCSEDPGDVRSERRIDFLPMDWGLLARGWGRAWVEDGGGFPVLFEAATSLAITFDKTFTIQ